MMKHLFGLLITIASISTNAQTLFTQDPSEAIFVTTDIQNFWIAFDQLGSKKNPFEAYLSEGSQGLKDFIPMRIESSKNLLKTVKKRKEEYLAIRESSSSISSLEVQIREAYKNLIEWYPKATFPPTYFVIGAMNTGGTATKNGLIIGVERQGIDKIPYFVAHEVIHFNQHYKSSTSLLDQSIREGSADFLGELISGKTTNEGAFEFGEKNEEVLCQEFVQIMNSKTYKGWLYGGGKKTERPRDLGYWMGYKISKSYFDRSVDKKLAVKEILNITDFRDFLNKSGYLNKYMPLR